MQAQYEEDKEKVLGGEAIHPEAPAMVIIDILKTKEDTITPKASLTPINGSTHRKMTGRIQAMVAIMKKDGLDKIIDTTRISSN